MHGGSYRPKRKKQKGILYIHITRDAASERISIASVYISDQLNPVKEFPEPFPKSSASEFPAVRTIHQEVVLKPDARVTRDYYPYRD